MKPVDLAIVGAGVVGLAHALQATRMGLSVAVFERSDNACGASVQNFGMLAVVAQANGQQLQTARAALTTWQQLTQEAGIELRNAGCLFLAREVEEMSVLEEFAESATQNGRIATLLTPEQTTHYANGVQQQHLLGGLWSPEAWKVDQRQAVAKIARYLQTHHGVPLHFSTEVLGVEVPHVHTSRGTFAAKQVLVCGGNEFRTLFPDHFARSGVTSCRLQMLRTYPQPGMWRLLPFVLGGLSLSRYGAFTACPSLPALKALQHRKYSVCVERGIHVIACQEPDGSVTIGDSHVYDNVDNPERSDEVDRLIIEELNTNLKLPNPRIAERWLGHYAHLPHEDLLQLSPAEGVTVITLTNGQGMTHAFGVAERVLRSLK